MEAEGVATPGGRPPGRTSRRGKLAFAIALAAVAAAAGYFAIFRDHPAEAVLLKALERVEEGDLEGMMEYVDPEGQLGTLWNENTDGARDTLTSLAHDYRIVLASLTLKTRAEGDRAEVDVAGGRVEIYERGEPQPLVFFDLADSDIVFYLERKGGLWLIEGTNYDVAQALSGERLPFPF